MRQVTPKVRLIASTKVNDAAIGDYLMEIGATSEAIENTLGWEMTPDKSDYRNLITEPEQLVQFAGKLCYNSFQPGLNPNVTKVRSDPAEYLDNILQSCHGSVLEHANFTFLFYNVSRVFTHEVVRHRAGCAMSQESLRYVRPTDLGMFTPSCLMDVARIPEYIAEVEKLYAELCEHVDLDKRTFEKKKELTSALRRILPQGMSTSILFTMNLRAVRHIVQMRTAAQAEEEIRIVFDEVGKIMQKECPLLWSDMTRAEIKGIGCWTSKYPSNPYDWNKES